MSYVQETRPQPAPAAKPVPPATRSFDRVFLRLVNHSFGTIGHVQIDSPDFNLRIRTRFQSEIDELTNLGFTYLASDGETFSLFRVIFVFPLLGLLGTLSDRVPTAVKGSQFMGGYPVLLSRDGTALANPNGMGVKFFTPYEDGAILISGNYHDPTTRAPQIIRQFQKTSIADAWTRHQNRMRALVSEGKQIERNLDYRTYTRLSHLETASW